ncbi:MAG: GNAT family N-acetyltransferase [Nostoc sp.]|uniref:GNAT family N-acetyltransferase n=1 Tax=Nostoc sp. TaxID=1180 RepID=UPI002FF78D75
MPEIETARLLLRPYTPQDMDELAPILSNPAVMRYSPRGTIPKVRVKEVTQETLQFFITQMILFTFCKFKFELG